MTENIKIVRPGIPGKSVIDEHGKVLFPPAGWELLKPGDAGVTRRVKAMGAYWQVESKRGRRTFSGGLWAPAENIAKAQGDMDAQRATPSYQKKMAAAKQKRDENQEQYCLDFYGSVLKYLNFAECYKQEAEQIARLVSDHATPVGSGTVARTTRIPVEKRAEAAVIAWMRHQTTAYDHMSIARIKGERREVRRMLATESVKVLSRYRCGKPISTDCPLKKALLNF